MGAYLDARPQAPVRRLQPSVKLRELLPLADRLRLLVATDTTRVVDEGGGWSPRVRPVRIVLISACCAPTSFRA